MRLPKIVFNLLILLALIGGLILGGCSSAPLKPLARDYTLDNFQEAGRWPNQDPVLLLSTMQLFYSTGRTQQGVRYFHSLSETYPDRALLKVCEGTLMAKMAYDVSLLKRIGWVNDALKKLDEAEKDGSVETLYLKGLVESELPGFLFGRASAAITDLNSVLLRQKELPFEATRGLHSALARAYATLGDEEKSKTHLKIAGLSSLDGPHLLSNNRVTSFLSNASITSEDGYRFVKPQVIEIANKLWVIQGYDFANMIAWETSEGVVLVDTGTTIPSAQKAKAALRGVTQKPIHTIIITHSHWDHVGGISVFMEPTTKVIASALFEQELQVVNEAPLPFKYIFGKHTKKEPYAFKPDHLVRKTEEISIGGLQLRLIPVSGGETADALIIYEGQNQIAVVGDILMPYFGAPWASEGSPENLLKTIGVLRELDAKDLIHGHDPLTRYFNRNALPGLEKAIEETIKKTKEMTSQGLTAAEILRNLKLPEVLKREPHAVLSFLVMREGLIQRVARENVGYWSADGEGIDPVTLDEMALAVDLVGGQTASAFIMAGENLMNRGDTILAARISRLGTLRYPENAKIKEIYLSALERLRDKNHLVNPFKFMIYSEMGKKELKPIKETNH
ncbi:MAG: MBL fold metallo-hydrolase [Nitrospirae bacterium]|nr:MBL fold metallo-hydrolase [Nitrospirota bacterium]